MYLNRRSQRFVLIGTVRGHGYDCREHRVNMFENSNFGVWNKVSHWVNFIKGVMKDLGEPVCWSGN